MHAWKIWKIKKPHFNTSVNAINFNHDSRLQKYEKSWWKCQNVAWTHALGTNTP